METEEDGIMYVEKNADKANNFKKMRLKRGYTQRGLAADSGVQMRAIQYIDQHGIDSTACSTAQKLAKALHCIIEDLMDSPA
jgi:DNA-binding Xre family transcriptional regulator